MSTGCIDAQATPLWPSFAPTSRRRVRKTPYSRTGCSTCKRRRKKCDGCTPRCHACIRLGLECEQFDAFCPINVVKPSRKPNGKSAEVKKNISTFRIIDQESETQESGTELQLVKSKDPRRPSYDLQHASRDPTSIETIVPSLSLFSSLSKNQSYLLQYYLGKLSGVLVNAVGDSNPLRSLIIPRLASSSLLLDAVCATAAVHISTSSDDLRNNFSTLGTQYYVRVLSAVREWIPQIKPGQQSLSLRDCTTIEMAILATMFLCKYEIIKDGVGNWRHHMLGIESMYKALSPEEKATRADTVAFVQSFLTYHKSIARITEPSTPVLDDDRVAISMDEDQPSAVDPYMGFSQNLIKLLRRVAGFTGIDTTDGGIELLKDEVQSVLRSLDTKCWLAERFTIPAGMSPMTIQNLGYVAEAYRCAVLACLHAVIDNRAERDSTASREAEWASIHAMVPVSKAVALTSCLEAISFVPLGCPEEAGLLPLLFIVACETKSSEQTKEALRRVEALGSHIGLGNVRCASELLHRVSALRNEWDSWHDWRGLLASSHWDLIIT